MTQETKFTPGPWVLWGDWKIVDSTPAHNEICTYGCEDEDMPWETKANVALIVAAPDMYEAAEAALECLENNGFGKAYAEELLRSALHKARGGA